MSGSISFTPYATTSPGNSFLLSTQGYVQGTMMDDTAAKQEITAGFLASGQALPMWPGCAIQELVNISGVNGSGLGAGIARSVSAATISGWSIANQNYSMVITPGQTVPISGQYSDVHYIRTGTNARVAVQCAASLATSLTGVQTSQQVSWDFNNQQLIPYVAAYVANVITAASWANTNGGQSSFTTTSAHGVTVGSFFTISGMTPSGYNGDYIAQTGTTGSTLVGIATPTQQLTTPGTATGFGTLVAGGGAAPVKVLEINSNSKIVSPYVIGSPLLWTTGIAALILV